jgi:hypothetical protein
MKQDLKGRRFAAVQQGSLASLDSTAIDDFRQCFQQLERRWNRCVQSQGQYFKGDKSFRFVRIF